MQVLGEEREFLAKTTDQLDAYMKERERLLLEVAEAKAKVTQQTYLRDLNIVVGKPTTSGQDQTRWRGNFTKKDSVIHKKTSFPPQLFHRANLKLSLPGMFRRVS